jgi:hypothetical protein
MQWGERRVGLIGGAPAVVLLAVVAVAGVAVAGVAGAGPAAAAQPPSGLTADVQQAAQLATAAGYTTGIGVLDLQTGAYAGGGEDTAGFASESVVKVLIATELLLSGQMTGATESTAYEMITESDDDAADALYGLAGGDEVVDLVAAHYGIPDLGAPPSEAGWWGNTQLTAKGLVQFYAAAAGDPTVGPWLEAAMAHATQYGADGTYQFFGLPSATTGAAVKQGWGDDGDDSPNAVFASTGYVENGRFAVAIFTDGPPSSYGDAISAVLTAQARALLPGGSIIDPTSSAAPPTTPTTSTTPTTPPAAPSTAASTTAAPPAAAPAGAGSGANAAAPRAASPLVRGGAVLFAMAVLAAVVGAISVRHR